VIAKAEHITKGANPRFVVTSLSAQQMPAQELYEKEYALAASAPRIALRSSSWICLRIAPVRARCGRINWRLYFSSDCLCSAANASAQRPGGTELEKAQVRDDPTEVAQDRALDRVTVRKVWVSLSSGYPHADAVCRVLDALQRAARPRRYSLDRDAQPLRSTVS